MFTCVYVFMAVQLDNQLVCSSLGKTTSLAPSFPQLCVVFWVELRPCGLFSCPLEHVPWFQACSAPVWATMAVRFCGDFTRRHSLTTNSLVLRLSQFFQPEAQECFVSIAIRFHRSVYWLVMVFCIVSIHCKEKRSWCCVKMRLICLYGYL